MLYICLLRIDCFQINKHVAKLTKRVELPFVPYHELNIAMQRRKSGVAAEEQEYATLLANACDPTAIIRVEQVTYYFQRPEGDSVFVISARSAVDEDIDRLNSYIKLMERFYGFEVDMFLDVEQ